MSKNKLIPELRFPEFKNEGEWEECSIESIGDVVTGGTPSKEDVDYWGGDFVWATAQDFKNKYILNSIQKLTQKGKDKSRIIPKDSVLVTCIASIGLNAINKIECATNQQINAIICKPQNHFEFVYYSISHNGNRLKNLAGRTAVPIISKSVFEKFIIHKPQSPLEQQKIATCLSTLDEVIAAHSQKLDLLKEHKKGLMQNLFPLKGETVPKYRFKEFEKDGEWVEKKLGEIAENLDSKRIPITSTQRDKGNIPYYGASGIVDYVKDYIFDETLLCISEDGANLMDRNYPIAFTITGKTWVNNHAHVLRFASYDTHVLVEKYINSINVQDFLTGMAQPKLNRGYLDIIPIPLPTNPKEQQKIASCLSSLDALITAQAEKIEQLKLHKKGLMQGLFPKING